jgi:hypothetical protein
MPEPNKEPLMLQSHIIEIDGVFVGAAVRLDRGYRFVATDMRLEDLDGSIWPNLEDVRRLARRALYPAPLAPAAARPGGA